MILMLVTLVASSTFSQTTKEVWTEQRGDNIVYVVAPIRAQKIARDLVDYKALKDSCRLMERKISIQDSININLHRENSLLEESIEDYVEIVDKKDQQIDNHKEIQGVLEDEVKAQKKRKWLFGLGGLITGFGIGVLVK